jgi:hypothetical protein
MDPNTPTRIDSSWGFSYADWHFTYQPGTRFVEAKHPAGGCFSVCEVTPSKIHHGPDQWGFLIAASLNRMTHDPSASDTAPTIQPLPRRPPRFPSPTPLLSGALLACAAYLRLRALGMPAV